MMRFRTVGRAAVRPTGLPLPLVGLPAVRPALRLLACLVVVVVPACGPEGAGSIHTDQASPSRVMVTPDRKAPIPSKTQARTGRTAPRSNLSRR